MTKASILIPCLVLAAALWTASCRADDAAPSVAPAAKAARRQIPAPPADLMIKLRRQEAQQAARPAQDVSSNVLAWDAEAREQDVPGGTEEARFAFTATNVSQRDVTLLGAVASCGCTVAKLPDDPRIVPGASGRIEVTMNLRGKYSKVSKTVTVSTDQGVKVLHVTTNLPAPTVRQIRQDMTLTDRQVVFKGECLKCHGEPARGKTGQALFASACGICHEAENRAAMVPDLHALKHETGAAFWRTAITHGKPGTLMPAFAQSEGGILTDAQIASLVEYLDAALPAKPQAGDALSVTNPPKE